MHTIKMILGIIVIDSTRYNDKAIDHIFQTLSEATNRFIFNTIIR